MSRRGGRERILLYLTIAGSMERAVEGTVSRALEINWQAGGGEEVYSYSGPPS